jgi:hypothetical protein
LIEVDIKVQSKVNGKKGEALKTTFIVSILLKYNKTLQGSQLQLWLHPAQKNTLCQQ